MKAKRLSAAIAAVCMSVSLMAAMPMSASADTVYTAIEGTKVTSFDKYLVMENDAIVPNAAFSFTVAGGEAVDAAADGSTLPVLAGVGTPKFVLKTAEGADNNNDGDDTTATVNFSAADTTIAEGDMGTGKTVKFTTASNKNDEKYAQKKIEIDFSGIEFTEPGIYRYIITEAAAGTNQAAGVTNDADILRYKPDPAAHSAAADSPITDEMVGWITIDGTSIDYPVMQGEDNTRFLSTDPFGNYSLTGSIFLDSRCSSDFSDDFSIIYGHHMDYGKLFGSLDDFLNRAYLKSHTTGTLLVGRDARKVYKLEVFASMRVSSREKTVFNMDSSRIRKFIQDNANGVTVDKDKRIIGLATCAGANSTTKTVVFCYISE